MFIAVAGIIVSNNRVLIQDHVKCDMLTCPIGKLELNESVEAGLEREMYEELNIRVTSSKLLVHESCNVQGMQIPTYVYSIDDYHGYIMNKEPEKHRSLRWYTVSELRNSGRRLSQALQLWLNSKE